MIFTGRSRGWRAYLPWNLSRAVHCAFSCARFPLFLCSHARLHRSVCFPLFLCHRRHASTVHTPFFFAFQPPVPREVNIVHVTFVFRVCCCNVICSVRHAAIVFCSATPVTKQACMTFVCIQRTKATGPVQFLKA